EGGKSRGHPKFGANHRASTRRGDAERSEIAARDPAGLRGRAGESQAKPVDHRALAKVRDVRGHVARAGSNGEAGNVIGQRAHKGGVGAVLPTALPWPAAASRAQSRTACSSAPVVAMPLPTMSKAVPCAGVAKGISRPAVMVTPRWKPLSLVAI